MDRRRFLALAASLLPLPAFVKASSLWLSPERPRILTPPPPEFCVLEAINNAAAKAAAHGWKFDSCIVSKDGFDALLEELNTWPRIDMPTPDSIDLSTPMGRVKITPSLYARNNTGFMMNAGAFSLSPPEVKGTFASWTEDRLSFGRLLSSPCQRLPALPRSGYLPSAPR
jgi:hypothetical protein